MPFLIQFKGNETINRRKVWHITRLTVLFDAKGGGIETPRRSSPQRIMIPLIALYALQLACVSHQPTPPFAVQFGIMEAQNDGNYLLTKESRTIPFGCQYGYQLTLADEFSHEIHDIFYLPDIPQILTGAFADASPEEALRGVQSPPAIMQKEWQTLYWFDPGDPLGRYRIEIYLDGDLKHVIEFDVIEKGNKSPSN